MMILLMIGRRMTSSSNEVLQKFSFVSVAWPKWEVAYSASISNQKKDTYLSIHWLIDWQVVVVVVVCSVQRFQRQAVTVCIRHERNPTSRRHAGL